MTAEGWGKFVMMIATENLSDLSNLFDIAKKVSQGVGLDVHGGPLSPGKSSLAGSGLVFQKKQQTWEDKVTGSSWEVIGQ